MKLDRDLQRKLLEELREHYPAPHFTNRMDHLHADPRHLMANAAYLIEHDLVAGEIRMTSTGRGDFMPTRLVLTAKGLDFLEDDGGLTAILGTLTVRLHADSIRDLLAARIEAAELEDSVKSQLISEVKSLPAKGLEAMIAGLAREGLARMPNAIQWLQTALTSVQ
jgi:hypothetical protein